MPAVSVYLAEYVTQVAAPPPPPTGVVIFKTLLGAGTK